MTNTLMSTVSARASRLTPDAATATRFTFPSGPTPSGDQLVTVVLKNPSSANAECADNAIRRVETYVFERFPRAREVTVLNLFTLRAADASDLAAHIADHGIGNATGDPNDAVIADNLNRSHRILLAWGGTSGISKPRYEERIHAVVQCSVRVPTEPAPSMTCQPAAARDTGFDGPIAISSAPSRI